MTFAESTMVLEAPFFDDFNRFDATIHPVRTAENRHLFAEESAIYKPENLDPPVEIVFLKPDVAVEDFITLCQVDASSYRGVVNQLGGLLVEVDGVQRIIPTFGRQDAHEYSLSMFDLLNKKIKYSVNITVNRPLELSSDGAAWTTEHFCITIELAIKRSETSKAFSVSSEYNIGGRRECGSCAVVKLLGYYLSCQPLMGRSAYERAVEAGYGFNHPSSQFLHHYETVNVPSDHPKVA